MGHITLVRFLDSSYTNEIQCYHPQFKTWIYKNAFFCLEHILENNCSLYSGARKIATSVQIEIFKTELLNEKNIRQFFFISTLITTSTQRDTLLAMIVPLSRRWIYKNHFSMSWLSTVNSCSAKIFAELHSFCLLRCYRTTIILFWLLFYQNK